MSHARKRTMMLAIAMLALPTLAQPAAQTPPVPAAKPATAATRAALAARTASLPPEDEQDFEFARRGFIATWPEAIIRQANGQPSFDLAGNDFIDGPAPDTVNPALWRQNRVLRNEGLFRIAPGLYQVRNFDNSNVTFVETPNGWIVIDPLTVSEVAAAALDLLKKHVANKPVLAVLYTHSHSDHFAGVGGVISPAELASGKVQVIAPKGFMDEVVSEWMIAGTAMGRRAFYQFGYFLPRGPQAHVGMGMGTAIAAGKQLLVPPTLEIERTGQSVTIDGVELVFQMTPGTEAPAEFNVWLPALKAMVNSETATGTLHNVQTLRGAKVRDAKAWSEYLTEAVRMWGDKVEVLVTSHHWPRFGNGVIREHLGRQRDAYKFIHDQSVRLMNMGETPDEIAEQLQLPAPLRSDWALRGFYGTVSHNAKAVYDRYMGWYDGVPANLNRHPPVERAKRLVQAMGGPARLLREAKRAFAAGDYRWSAELAHNGVFANSKDMAARAVLADSYEQLGYQAESAVWRNIYLTGARELRQGHPDTVRETGPNFLTLATPLHNFMDLVATTLVPDRAGTATLAFNLVDSGTGDRVAVRLANQVLVTEPGQTHADAPTLTAPKPMILGILFGALPLDAALKSGRAQLAGDGSQISQLVPMLSRPSLDFNIVEP